MSWINRELKRRTTEPKASVFNPSPAAAKSDRIKELWASIQAVNDALPAELQLRAEKTSPISASPEDANIRDWLKAPNGAALGFAGTAIRYVWPERGKKVSNNFWMFWNEPLQRYALQQRASASIPPAVTEYKIKRVDTEKIVKCLVLGKRIKPRAVRIKRFWLF